MIPKHEDPREYKDIPVRELLATAMQHDIEEIVVDAVNGSIMHCIALPDHDEPLRSLTTKLNDFVLSFVGTEEGHCAVTVLMALHFALVEHINRMEQSGEINEFLDGTKN